MYDPVLRETISEAVSRVHARLQTLMPFLEPRLREWLEAVAGDIPLAERLQQPTSFPMLLLPWWLEEVIRDRPDPSFQADIVYSTVNGYLFIRLIDNTMDRDGPSQADILPALALFHSQFQAPYHRYFAHDDAFWDMFAQQWLHCADVTAQDATLQQLDEAEFTSVAAQKTSAGKIPLAAVCFRYTRVDLLPQWARFHDLLGRWHQMSDDLRDWYKDLSHHNVTYLLSTAEQRRSDGESVPEWMLREGYRWAVDVIAGWMAEMKRAAAEMHSPALVSYLHLRQELQHEEHARLLDALPRIEQFLTVLRAGVEGR